MYNGGTQCVKVAHRKHGMCRTNVWINDELAFKLPRTLLHSQTFLLVTVLEWSLFSMVDYLMDPVSTVPFRLYHQMVQH